MVNSYNLCGRLLEMSVELAKKHKTSVRRRSDRAKERGGSREAPIYSILFPPLSANQHRNGYTVKYSYTIASLRYTKEVNIPTPFHPFCFISLQRPIWAISRRENPPSGLVSIRHNEMGSGIPLSV